MCLVLWYEELRVVCINFATSKGLEIFRKHGLSCGGVILQGYPDPHINLPSVQLPVIFEGPIGGEWTKRDLERAIERAITALKASQ